MAATATGETTTGFHSQASTRRSRLSRVEFMQRPSYQDDLNSRTQVVVRRNLGEPQISGIAYGCKCHSPPKAEIQRARAVLGTLYDGSPVSRRNCHFNTRHALPLTFVRILRPRISRENHAKRPHSGRGEAPIHGSSHVLDLDVSHPGAGTRQSLGRTSHTDWSETCPCPPSIRIHRLAVAINPPKTAHVLAQSTGSQRAHPSPELTRALDRSCPTGEIVQAAFSPRSRQSPHKGATAYVLI